MIFVSYIVIATLATANRYKHIETHIFIILQERIMNFNKSEESLDLILSNPLALEEKAKNKKHSSTQNPLEAIARDLQWLNLLNGAIVKSLLPDQKEEERNNYRQLIRQYFSVIPKTDSDCPYDNLLIENNFQVTERMAILLSIAPYFSPVVLNPLSALNPATNNTFPQLGGYLVSHTKEFFATIDTLRYLLAGENIQNIHFIDSIFNGSSPLIQKNILRLWSPNGETIWNKQVIQPTDEFLAIISGKKYEPTYRSSFPASKITTKLSWDDLVLPYDTMKELREISIWLQHHHTILNHEHLSKIIKPGFRCLFYGPPGTGKTLTASLLGKTHNMDVYRIDLSMVVSKWVGETEKNLKGIFDQALNKNWILFFDEADSLFGKRTQTKSSNDRYANQEVAYLLQRIEDFPGLVVLATNMKDNIDEAFSRRFQSMVYFPNPDAESRYTLWKNSLPLDYSLENGIELYDIAKDYDITGGIIINVVRYCVLMALHNKRKTILAEDLEVGIQKELRKNGRIIA